jgi:hypothetical protein
LKVNGVWIFECWGIGEGFEVWGFCRVIIFFGFVGYLRIFLVNYTTEEKMIKNYA